MALEPSQATEAASQPLELTLRDWQPSTASQLIRSQATPSQDPQHAEHAHHSSQSFAPGEHRQSSLAGESRGQPEQSPGGAVPSQDPQHAQHTHHSSQGSLCFAPHEHRHSILQREIGDQLEQHASKLHDGDEMAEDYGGGLSTCKDVLDMADEAGEPDLAHAWEEEPAGIGEVSEEAHQSGSQGAATKAATALRTWACQVWEYLPLTSRLHAHLGWPEMDIVCGDPCIACCLSLVIWAMCIIRTTAHGLIPRISALMLTDANMAAAGMHF